MLACLDTLCVPAVCGSGDVTRVSNFWFKPVKAEVLEATAYTRWQVSVIEDRYAAPHARGAAAQLRELDALVAAGFAEDREDALRRAFFTWYAQARQRSW